MTTANNSSKENDLYPADRYDEVREAFRQAFPDVSAGWEHEEFTPDNVKESHPDIVEAQVEVLLMDGERYSFWLERDEDDYWR
jgi:hypothetical protein